MEGVDFVVQADKTLLHLLAKYVRGYMKVPYLIEQIAQLVSSCSVLINGSGSNRFHSFVVFFLFFTVFIFSSSDSRSGVFRQSSMVCILLQPLFWYVHLLSLFLLVHFFSLSS